MALIGTPARRAIHCCNLEEIFGRMPENDEGMLNPMSNNMVMEKAIEVFARGFSFTRSFTHPYLAHWEESLWVVRDAPRKSGRYRREEWIGHGIQPSEIDRVARKHTRGYFAICAICAGEESDAGIRAEFKKLNYRLNRTEAVMVHGLRRIPRVEAPLAIEWVTTPEMADRLNEAARARQILPEHLSKGAPVRQYVALEENQPVGWVRSIEVNRATWCSNLFVVPASRRRGIGRALMSRMLRDDQSNGSELAVLTASHAGAMLYPKIGYEQIGTLLFYTPKKR